MPELEQYLVELGSQTESDLVSNWVAMSRKFVATGKSFHIVEESSFKSHSHTVAQKSVWMLLSSIQRNFTFNSYLIPWKINSYLAYFNNSKTYQRDRHILPGTSLTLGAKKAESNICSLWITDEIVLVHVMADFQCVTQLWKALIPWGCGMK